MHTYCSVEQCTHATPFICGNFRSLLASTPWLFWAICYSTTACRCSYGMSALPSCVILRTPAAMLCSATGFLKAFVPHLSQRVQGLGKMVLCQHITFFHGSAKRQSKSSISLWVVTNEHVHVDPCCRSVVGDFGGCAAATSTRSIVSSLQYEIFGERDQFVWCIYICK